MSIDKCKYWTKISIKGQTSIFQRRKPSKWWPNMVMAKDASHTFSGTPKSLVAQMDLFYEMSINECKYWTKISIKARTNIFQRRKPSKWWPNMVMAKDGSHTFHAASVVLMAPMEFFWWESSSPPWATVCRILTILPTVWWVKMAIKVKNGQSGP